MVFYTTEETAKRLGIGITSLHHYIAVKKVPAPEPTKIGKRNVRAWTEEDIERVRKLLPKIANGRKTRYQKLREKQKAQPGAAVPHKSRKSTKKQTPQG
jgi:predicted DNA-binding transcriptional regulator AlpA